MEEIPKKIWRIRARFSGCHWSTEYEIGEFTYSDFEGGMLSAPFWYLGEYKGYGGFKVSEIDILQRIWD